MKSFILSCLFISFGAVAISQNIKPVTWDFKVTQNEDLSYTLTATAKIKEDWAIYSQYTGKGGPRPLKFSYDENVVLIGNTKEDSEAIKKMSELFEVEVIKFENQAIFTQKFNPKTGQSSIKGSLNFMCCDGLRCLPPTDVTFDVPL